MPFLLGTVDIDLQLFHYFSLETHSPHILHRKLDEQSRNCGQNQRVEDVSAPRSEKVVKFVVRQGAIIVNPQDYYCEVIQVASEGNVADELHEPVLRNEISDGLVLGCERHHDGHEAQHEHDLSKSDEKHVPEQSHVLGRISTELKHVVEYQADENHHRRADNDANHTHFFRCLDLFLFSSLGLLLLLQLLAHLLLLANKRLF